jgi:hypothetical protein
MLDPLNINIPLSHVETRPAQRVVGKKRFLLKRTDKPDEYILEWDYSGAAYMMRCPRSAENYHVFKRELAKDQSATSFGRLFHKLGEAKDRNGLTPETVTFQNETIAKHFMEYPCSPTDHRDAFMMNSVIALYNERYKNDQWDKKVFTFEGVPFLERPFKIELCSIPINAVVPYPAKMLLEDGGEENLFIKVLHIHYVGRIDLVLAEAEHLWVVDRKTSSRGGQEFEDAFRLSLQTRMYGWAVWQITGRRPLGCILDAAVVRKATATGKGTTLDRKNYFYSEDSLAEAADCMRAHVSDFVACLVRGFFPQSAQSFKSPCAGCDFQENCALPKSQRAGDIYSDIYRDVTWNPLTEQ